MCTTTRNCCHRSARERQAIFCEHCGDPLLRCSNHPICDGLLNSENFCPECFSPELRLMADQEKVAVGQAAHVRMELSNRSTCNQTLVVKQAWIRIGNKEWTPVSLSWDRVDSGQSRPIRFTTRPFETGGEHGAEIVFVLGARNGFREDAYVFVANFALVVEDQQNVVVQQNIHYAAEAPQTGATIYAPVRVQSQKTSSSNDRSGIQLLELHRATRYEQHFEVRPECQPHVGPRSRIEFEDSKSRTRYTIQRFAQRRSQMVFGRSRTWLEGGTNDVRLLFTDPTGIVDEDSSLQISREHFCLYEEQGLLKIRSLGSRGIRLDGKALLPGETQSVRDGSRIEILADSARIQIQVTLNDSGNNVACIRLRQV